MDLQTAAVIVCVAIALGFLGRELWRTVHPSDDGCGGCGCASRILENEDRDRPRSELPIHTPSQRDP